MDRAEPMDLDRVRALAAALKGEIGKVVVGQEPAVDLMLVGLLADGHILLEGVPGTAKTLLARTFSACLHLDLRRVQFTPDLMPGDIIGTNLFDFQRNQFSVIKGPIFTQLLLADEINRTPPKTQAALLEAMQERSVTIDGTVFDLGSLFMVVATQNPVEHQGTYPLPEAQLDRFLFKHIVDYPSEQEEQSIVARHGTGTSVPSLATFDLQTVANLAAIQAARGAVEAVGLTDDIVAYIVAIVRATRENPSLEFGASPRASTMLAAAARALATLRGRDFVIPDDIKYLALPALRHRVVLAPAAEIEGTTAEAVIEQILDQVPAPR